MLEVCVGVDDSDMSFDDEIESIRVVAIVEYTLILVGLD